LREEGKRIELVGTRGGEEKGRSLPVEMLKVEPSFKKEGIIVNRRGQKKRNEKGDKPTSLSEERRKGTD